MYHGVNKRGAITAAVAMLALSVMLVPACRRDVQGDDITETPVEPVQLQQKNLLSFPDELYVEDESVNEFVRQAMDVCASGDYDAFRLLWTARQDPLPHDEFEKGWQAVEEIHVRALERVRLVDEAEDGQGKAYAGYAVFAEVHLDPTHIRAKVEPDREVVLAMVREHDQWRLAKAPKAMREWLKERITQVEPSIPHEPSAQGQP